MRSFCVRADNVRSVVVNEGIIRSDPRGFGENRAVLRGVWGLRTNEADEVMHRSCFVVHDLEEEGRNDLPDSCEVGVERLPGDWLKLIERMREFCHNLLGPHCVQIWRSCRLQGQVPPSSGSYIFIEK